MARSILGLAALAALPAACAGNPQGLPVGVSACNALATPRSFTIIARVENKSDRPISNMSLSTQFYQNFRYQRYEGSAQLKQELDPGQKRDVTFIVAAANSAQFRGQAIRCFITHIGYLDGTSQDAPPNR